MPENKLHGNDGQRKEFYGTLWDELKIPLIARLRKSFLKELSNSPKQVVIRLIERKRQL